MKSGLLFGLIFFSLTTFAADTSVHDPYSQVAFVTNTVAWPYQSANNGTESFRQGTAQDKNEDTLILNQVVQNGFHFPASFNFGAACSAYQYEGNRIAPSEKNTAGIGWSMWDVFSEKKSWLNPKGTNISEVPPTSEYTKPNGEIAIKGFYPEFYKEDIRLAKNLGVNYYRLSISWPRLFPHAHMNKPDPKGVAYYQTVLRELQKHHIKVLITLYHWDLPAWLYNYGDPQAKDKTYGWLDMSEAKNNLVLKEFQKYVAASYQAFGSFTPYFATFNEPLTFTNSALVDGVHAPGQYGFEILQQKNSELYGANLQENVQRIPYLQAINLVKAHYIAYKTIHYLYQTDKQHHYHEAPNVSMVLNSDWAEPYRIECGKNMLNCHYNQDDVRASQNNMNYMLGWWLDPMMFGVWPKDMAEKIYDKNARLKNVGIDERDSSCLRADGLPIQCAAQKNNITLAQYIREGGALDSLAINHYTGYFAVDMNYAKAHFNKERISGAIPPNQSNITPDALTKGWATDQNAFITQFRYDKYFTSGETVQYSPIEKQQVFIIGNSGNKPWLRQTWFVYRKLLQYINTFYLQDTPQNSVKHPQHTTHTKSNIDFSNLDIYLTENGTSIFHESQIGSVHDYNRIQYLIGNLGALQQAINEDHINLKLYTYWSLLDNFEWSEGYDSRFGLVWIDYAHNNTRKPKQSYYCYQAIIKNKNTGVFPKACMSKELAS